jgi:hypothetical protein
VAGKHHAIRQGNAKEEVGPSKALQAKGSRKSARAKGFEFDLIHGATPADDSSANNDQPVGNVTADAKRGDGGR